MTLGSDREGSLSDREIPPRLAFLKIKETASFFRTLRERETYAE